MPTMDSLEDLLKDEIKDIYDAENQLTKALPKLIKKATADDLKTALSNHLEETQEHIARLERVFKLMQMPVRGKKCEGMQHLIAEGSEMIAECEEDGTRDAVIIAAAQKCEHYEICSYGTIRVCEPAEPHRRRLDLRGHARGGEDRGPQADQHRRGLRQRRSGGRRQQGNEANDGRLAPHPCRRQEEAPVTLTPAPERGHEGVGHCRRLQIGAHLYASA